MSERVPFVPPDLRVKQWEDIEPYFEQICRSKPKTLKGLMQLLQHYSDALSVYMENSTKLGIALGSNTADKAARSRYDSFF